VFLFETAALHLPPFRQSTANILAQGYDINLFRMLCRVPRRLVADHGSTVLLCLCFLSLVLNLLVCIIGNELQTHILSAVDDSEAKLRT